MTSLLCTPSDFNNKNQETPPPPLLTTTETKKKMKKLSKQLKVHHVNHYRLLCEQKEVNSQLQTCEQEMGTIRDQLKELERSIPIYIGSIEECHYPIPLKQPTLPHHPSASFTI
jgi:hypothetical protein